MNIYKFVESTCGWMHIPPFCCFDAATALRCWTNTNNDHLTFGVFGLKSRKRALVGHEYCCIYSYLRFSCGLVCSYGSSTHHMWRLLERYIIEERLCCKRNCSGELKNKAKIPDAWSTLLTSSAMLMVTMRGPALNLEEGKPLSVNHFTYPGNTVYICYHRFPTCTVI